MESAVQGYSGIPGLMGIKGPKGEVGQPGPQGRQGKDYLHRLCQTLKICEGSRNKIQSVPGRFNHI